MKQLIVWDIDGTLMDCQGIGRQALNLTLESLYGIEEGFKSINFAGTIDRQIIDEAKKLHQLVAFEEEAFWQLYKDILTEEIQKNPRIKMISGIQVLLDHLALEKDLYHMLCTGNAKVGAWIKLEWTRLAPYFSHGAYGDEAPNREALVALAIERAKGTFGVSFLPSDVFVVGDTPLDVQAAQANSAVSVAVATGRFSADVLKDFHPDYVFENFNDFDAFLEILGRSKRQAK